MKEVSMKYFLTGIFAASFIVLSAAAQDNATPGSQPPTSPTQSTTPASPQAGQQMPEKQMPSSRTSPGTSQSPSTQSPSSTPGSGATQAGSPTRIAPGSVIPVELAKTIDAKKAKTGDEVVAKVTQDLKTNSGQIIIAKDTKVMGHVTEAQARNKEQKESQLGISFDKAVPRIGSEIAMPMSIQAIIGPQQNDQNNAGGGNTGSTPSTSAGSPATGAGARPGMSGSSPANQSASADGGAPSEAQSRNAARPPITGTTKGVIGISNLTLADGSANASQGSVLTSDKNNVKLESGTMMLLRVNP
jgi:hypothetical protein